MSELCDGAWIRDGHGGLSFSFDGCGSKRCVGIDLRSRKCIDLRSRECVVIDRIPVSRGGATIAAFFNVGCTTAVDSPPPSVVKPATLAVRFLGDGKAFGWYSR